MRFFAGGDPVEFGGPLEPGKTRRLKGTSARFADFQPGVSAAAVHMLAAIDLVLFDYCIYQPARALAQPAKAPPLSTGTPR